MGDDRQENGIPAAVAAAIADLAHENGRVAGCFEAVSIQIAELGSRVGGLPCAAHLARLDAIDAKLSTKSPSNLYEAVGARIDKHEDEVTERLNLVAREAVASAIEDRAQKEAERLKQENEREVQRIDLQHRRAMNWIKIVAAALGIVGGGGGIVALKALWGAEDGQVKTEQALRRIEAKQAKPAVIIVRPDAGE